MIKVVKLSLVLLLLTSCGKSSPTDTVNDKLINGYSYPVEGGINSYYVHGTYNVITFYNIKSDNLFSICEGEVVKSDENEIVVECKTGEKVVYQLYNEGLVSKDEKVSAGQLVAKLEAVNDGKTKRYKTNLVFYVDDVSLTDKELFEYIKQEREWYEKK